MDRARRRTPSRAVARIVVCDFTDQCARRSSADRAARPGALCRLCSLLLLLSGLLFLLIGLLGGLEGIGAGVLHGPVVALGLVLGLLAGVLPRTRERIDAQGGCQRLLSRRCADGWWRLCEHCREGSNRGDAG